MAATKKPKQDDPKQSKRFIETATAVGGSKDPKDFDKAFNRVATKSPKKQLVIDSWKTKPHINLYGEFDVINWVISARKKAFTFH